MNHSENKLDIGHSLLVIGYSKIPFYFYRISLDTRLTNWNKFDLKLILKTQSLIKIFRKMRIISVNIGDTIIEFDNDMWTGHENIYVNGELVSRKFSWFGTDHIFEVEENGVWVEYVLTTGFGWMGITADITRDGIPIVESGRQGMNLSVTTGALNAPKNYRSDEFV